MSDAINNKVLGVMVVDLERAAIGTRSRVGDVFAGKVVLRRVLERLLAVRGVSELAILAPADQVDRVWAIIGPEDRVRVMALEQRSGATEARVRAGRAWNLLAWRGGAGQWTCFDEEYHPTGIARACAEAFGKTGADHLLVVHSHAVFLDVEMTSALVEHHLHKNHEMRVTYTPAAPGLSGMVMRADIVMEMGEKNVLPWQLLGYDPKAPAFDTLIREACMQVDPALSKVPNRFCVDTQRSWGICETLAKEKFGSAAEMCLAAARVVAPGVKELGKIFEWPREVEIELTGKRLTQAAGSVPAEIREGRGEMDARRWVEWLSRGGLAGANGCDDLLVTFAGDGDPLLYEGLVEVLRAARVAEVLSVCVQTDLVEGVDRLIEAIQAGVVDVVSVMMYGHTAETYGRVAGVGVEVHGAVMRNMGRLAGVVSGRGGMPLVVPRLLKVRETIPELEPFFDFWVERCGWAVIDGPTDRAGAVTFGGVVDMAPPRRKPCRRLWERMVVRADGTAVACDQDIAGKLRVGNMEGMTIQEMWRGLHGLREMHAAERWREIDPCNNCREWHRA